MKHYLLACLAMVLLLGPGTVPQGGAAEPLAIMPVDELRVGMKGEGRTVFSGQKIETFDAEILGVLKNVFPRGDLILARLSGGPLARTGVIQGMSGSPVYVDGKLIGAVAYGFAFAQEAISGITPAGEMLSIMAAGAGREPERNAAGRAAVLLAEPFAVRGQEFDRVLFSPSGMPRAARDRRSGTAMDRRSMVFVPMAMPLMVSGFEEAMLGELERFLGPLGLEPIQAGGAVRAGRGAAPLRAGSALGAQLMRGDLDMTAIGTVTWRRGDEVVGFGHPMLSGGQIELPMTGGVVHVILASRQHSFKLASATEMFGTVVQDRQKGIGGVVGRMPAMVPVKVAVRRGERDAGTYRFKVIRHNLLTPQLVSTGIANALLASSSSLEGVTSHIEFKARISDGKDVRELKMEDRFYSVSPAGPVSALAAPLAWLSRSRFGPVTIDDVEVRVELEEGRRTAAIVSARAEKSRVAPGGEIRLRVRLEPYGGEVSDILLTVPVPEDAREGIAMVTVCDGMTSRSMEMARAPGRFFPSDLGQFLELVREQDRQTEVVVRVSLQRKGLTVRGKEVPSLPDSVLAVMSSSADTDAGPARVELKKKVKTEWVGSGRKQVKVVVRMERTGRGVGR